MRSHHRLKFQNYFLHISLVKVLFIVNQHHLHMITSYAPTWMGLSMSRDSLLMSTFSVRPKTTYLSQKHSITKIMQFEEIAFIVCYMLNYWIATALCTYTRIVINFNHNFRAVCFNLLIACMLCDDEKNFFGMEGIFRFWREKFSWHWEKEKEE